MKQAYFSKTIINEDFGKQATYKRSQKIRFRLINKMKITTTLLFVFLFFTNIIICYSQLTFHDASTPETPIGAANINNVTNTGADMIKVDQDYCKVMVFDGNAPQFAWERNSGSGIEYFYLDGVWDPDVVLTNDKMYALVCFEIESHTCSNIYLSLWEYDGGGNYIEIVGNFGQYSFPHFIDEGINPNIDIGFDDRFIITWHTCNETPEIKAIAGEYTGGVVDLSPNIALVAPETAWTPDVTICYDYVTFTYIRLDEQSYPEWVTQETSYIRVFNDNVIGNLVIHVLHSSIDDNYGVYGRPRIASPPQYQHYPGSDYTTVVDYYWEDGHVGQWDILVCQNDNGSINYPPWNYSMNIASVPNYEPVVTYIGDMGVVCWTAYIEYPYNTNYYSLDVVGLYFETSGNNGNPWGWDGSVVNYNYQGTQHIPSVAGRRWNDGYGFYFWRDGDSDVDDMVHRTSYQGNMHMRKTTENESLTQFTNEKDDFKFSFYANNIAITSGYENFALYLTDITGRLIFKKNASYETTFDISTFTPGVFFVTCIAGETKKTIKFIKH